MPVRFQLPDKYCSGADVRLGNHVKKYRVDPLRPGQVLVENPRHIEALRRDLGQPEAHGESDRASFGAATAETAVCPACHFEHWAWVERCPRCN